MYIYVVPITFSAIKPTESCSLCFLPLVIIHGAGARLQPFNDAVVPPVPAHGGLPQTQHRLFVAHYTAVVSCTGVC